MMINLLAFTFVFLGGMSCCCEAQSPWRNAVRRSSTDVDADLVAALLEQKRFADCAKICLAELGQHPVVSDDAALWSVRLSQTLTAKAMQGTEFTENTVLVAQRPVREILDQASDHSRKLFLQSQLLAVQRDAARHAVVIASVSPAQGNARTQASDRLVRVSLKIKELIRAVDEARIQLDNGENSPRIRSLRNDIQRLHQELNVEVVSLELLQIEMFEPGSQDYVAAAKRAEIAADQALLTLRNDTQARREIRRLRTKAILATGRPGEATTLLTQLAREYGRPLPASLLALRMEIDLAQGSASQAERRLQAVDQAGTSSVELDLIRLRILLARDDPRTGDWLDQLEKRHGVFVRRRAEAISIGRLGKSGTVDPSLVAAQGKDWLRRGDPARAATLLTVAADAETDSSRALTRATEAAAAHLKAGQASQAADVLARVAVAHRTAELAPSTHLQSALILVKQKSSPKELLSLLKQNLELWPQSKQSSQTRTWLIQILESQENWLEAAQVASGVANQSADEQGLELIRRLWVKAVRAAEPSDRRMIGEEFASGTRDLRDHVAVQRAAVIVLSTSQLNRFTPTDQNSFEYQLWRYRQSGAGANLTKPSPVWLSDTVWRIMADARENRALKPRYGQLLVSWQLDDKDPIESVERLLWVGQIARAESLLQERVKKSQSPGRLLQRAANVFAASENQASQRKAVAFLDQLAAGLRKGTPAWHEAKLDGIGLLARIGQTDEAKRRAKYILLTTPPSDAKLKSRYEGFE